MTRVQIMQDLLAALAAISPLNGHAVQVRDVRRGIHLAEEFNELPALSLFNEAVDTRDLTGGSAERELILHVWGAAKAVNDNYAELDALAASCLRMLADPARNPHWQATSCGRLEMYEGGAGDPLGLFDLEVRVIYESPLGTL